jgi:tetratricopeptide (TPR) repeat protein
MLNIHQLERRWLKYKIKSYLPKALFASLVLSLLVLSSIYLPLQKSEKIGTVQKYELNITQNKPLLVAAIQEKLLTEVEIEVPKNTQELPSTIRETSLVLKPSLRFMDKIEEDVSSYVATEYIEPESIKKHPALQRKVQESPTVYNEELTKSEPEPEAAKEEKNMLTITKQEDESDLKDIIRRFKNNKNPALSLFIAKRYYSAKQYQKSYNYALMTNEIDQNIDESWIVFSKSLVKLGQHELAINTLKAYLKTSKSTAAEALLRSIETGDFR